MEACDRPVLLVVLFAVLNTGQSSCWVIVAGGLPHTNNPVEGWHNALAAILNAKHRITDPYGTCLSHQLLVGLSLVDRTACSVSSLNLVYSWKSMEYELTSGAEDLIKNHSIPFSIDRWHDKLFIATPRFKTGVPSTLNFININGTAAKNMTSPKLIPYPDEAVHRLSAKKMTSIISIRVDPCGRLWALDTGEVAGKRETPPAIHVIDLKMNVIIRSHLFKEREDYDTDSQLSTIAVDVTSSNCEDAYAYVTDYVRYMLIIYSWRNDASYRETHNFFHFDPLFGFIINNGRHIHVRHGIYSLATSPVDRDGYRRLYFNAYASTMQFIISTKILQNKTFNYERPMYEFKVMGSRGPRGQSSAASLDEETGILFYTLIAKNALGCWNSFRGEEFSEKTQGIIVQDDTELSYPNDVRVDKTGILWLLVNNYIAYQLNQLEADSFNFKIFKGKVRQIIRGSVCEEV